MKRRSISAQIGALILAVSLVTGDAVPTLATQAYSPVSNTYVETEEVIAEEVTTETEEVSSETEVVEETENTANETEAVEETENTTNETETVEETETTANETETVEETETTANETETVEETETTANETETVEETETTANETEVVEEIETTANETEAVEATELTEKTIAPVDEIGTAGLTAPSKVIGVDAYPDYDGTYMNAKGEYMPYVYVKDVYALPVVVAAQSKESLKDPVTGLYKYAGKYYDWATEISAGYYRLSYPATVVNGAAENYKDAATGMYKINNKYYSYVYTINQNMFYYYEANAVVVAGIFENSDAFKAQYGVDVNADEYIDYYSVNGRCFGSYGSRYISSGKYAYYLSNEISFTEVVAEFTWNSVTSNDGIDSKGRAVKIGYEVLINGATPTDYQIIAVDSSNKVHYVNTWGSCEANITLKAGEKATGKVRALYYHVEETKDAEGNVVKKNVIDSFGQWSDTFTYTATGLKVLPKVSNLKAVQKDETIELTWNQIEAASSYYCRIIKSAKQLPIKDAASFNDYYSNYSTYNKNDATLNISTDYDYVYNGKETYTSTSLERPYMYFMMRVSGAPSGYYVTNSWSNVVGVKYSEKINTPAIKNFRVEKTNNGAGWQLAWDQVDADVVVYAFAEGKKPADIPYFNYGLLNAYRYRSESSTSKVYLSYALTSEQTTKVNRYVKYATTDGMDGVMSSNNFSLKPGVKYNFVAYTYDSVLGKQNPIGKELDGVGFDYYRVLGSASAMASYTATVGKPSVYTYGKKTSVKLTMAASNATGYIIYRKDGKKYKKIATTTDEQYTDTGLKTGKKYTYKVTAYYYDPLTKKKLTGKSTVKSVTTTKVTDWQVQVTKASKSSAKIKWTKVKSATKYEIYRSVENCDPTTVCKKLGSGSTVSVLANYKYELIKTVKKASTTSYTDKGLTSGETYSYLVLAYFKDGKTTAFVSGGGTVAMELETPKNVKGVIKGSSAKITWDADKYAAKYEVRYKIYDKYNNLKSEIWTKASTTKTSYTIKNLGSGEYAYVQVRAYGSNKAYSSWSGVSAVRSLAAPTNIKAVNDTKKGAVKITWKKVSGAKYYKVYRSTVKGTYNSDEKKYAPIGTLISKEANDNTKYNSYYDNSVSYKEYLGVTGSITGTSAYDYAILQPGVKYYYYVIAYGEKGTNIASYMRGAGNNVETYASGKPGEVIAKTSLKVTLTNKKTKKVTVKFNKVTGAKSYKIYRATKKNGEYKLIKTTTKTSYTDKKLKKGKTYYYKVVAEGTNGLKADFSVTSAVKSVKVKK